MDTEREVGIGMAGSCHQRKVRLVMTGLLWEVRKREKVKKKGDRRQEMAGHIEKGGRNSVF